MSVNDLKIRLAELDKEKEEIVNQIRGLEPVTQSQLEEFVTQVEEKLKLQKQEIESLRLKRNEPVSFSGGGFICSRLSYSEFTPIETPVVDVLSKTINTKPEGCVDNSRLYSQ